MRYSVNLLVLVTTLFVQSASAQTNQELRDQGERALQAKDFAAAVEAFTELVQHSQTPENYENLATAEAAAGQLEHAITHVQEAIHLGNRTGRSYYNLGLLFMEAQKPSSAIEAFRQAAAADPANLESRYGLGLALMTSGQPAAAASLIEKTLRQSPRESRLWAILVNAQFDAGNSTAALVSTQKALKNIPDDARLDVTLATTCLRFQSAQRARELLEDAAELLPDDPEVALLLARASLMAAEPVEALAVIEGMPAANRKGTERLLLLGEARALTGELDKATEDLRLAVRDEPDNPQCLAAYAWLLNLTGHHEQAIATLTHARSLLPRAPWIPYRIAVSYYFLGNYAQAEKTCDELVQLAPKYAPAYFVRGISRLKENRPDGARADLLQAATLAPANALFHREFAIALYDKGTLRAAKEQLDLALRLDPKDAEGYFWRAKSLESVGEKQEAIADLNTAVNLSPGYSLAYSELVDLYNRTGHPEKAAAVLGQQRQAGAGPQPSDDSTLLRTLPETTP